MKLINKISRYFLLSSILLFILISGGLYLVIEDAITNETDEQLNGITELAVQELKTGKSVNFYPFVEIIPVDQVKTSNEYKNILINSKDEEDAEPYRQLTSFVKVNGNQYKIITRISLIEKEDMLFSVMIVSIITVFIFVLIMYFLNKSVSKNILRDFYNTIKKLETFSLKSNDELLLNKSDIEEFDKLNKSLLFLAEKAKSDYKSLKEFSEETNHETQTPIAVIKSKLEILLQSSDLNKENLSDLDIALKNLNKLQRINKSILLLNKLEHKDLFESTTLKLNDEIQSVIQYYNDFIISKNLTLNVLMDDKFFINANQSLINILLGNIISNAIKHNHIKGILSVQLTNNELIISNSGLKPKFDTKKFFARFYKESNYPDSVGLGLTIVKKICDLYGITVKNDFSESLYSITLNFTNIISKNDQPGESNL